MSDPFSNPVTCYDVELVHEFVGSIMGMGMCGGLCVMRWMRMDVGVCMCPAIRPPTIQDLSLVCCKIQNIETCVFTIGLKIIK